MTDNEQANDTNLHWQAWLTNRWLMFFTVNVILGAYFGYALVAPVSSVKTSWLPGETSHGHYQIELDCNACHDPGRDADDPSDENVMSDACLRCHGDQLKASQDTHPAKKFNDPTNAELLSILDAQDCLSCHQEHVPERTLAMGLTMPADYCWHCHQDVADSRESHRGMAFDSCSTAGCHNYHDNRALYEKFLDDHYGEPDLLAIAQVPTRTGLANRFGDFVPGRPLSIDQADSPESVSVDSQLMTDWAETAHSVAGVNCSGCHGGDGTLVWTDTVSLETCARCHEGESKTFLAGKHGMRLAAGLSPMQPGMARLPMHELAMHGDLSHASLDCNACHSGHRFDTAYAAADACLNCHADEHSMAYRDSAHARLWIEEQSGEAAANTGVSCATCHMPRLHEDGTTTVIHDQNANLRPNETMARQVCMNCHALEYSLSSLAEPSSIKNCFSKEPDRRIKSVEMAHEWFVAREAKRQARMKDR